jgi:hypothetical protein
MNLYLISQDVNEDYDTYDSAVVVAESEDAAQHIHPQSSNITWRARPDFLGQSSHAPDPGWYNDNGYSDSRSWAPPDKVKVKLIGVSPLEAGTIVCSSFNAG